MGNSQKCKFCIREHFIKMYLEHNFGVEYYNITIDKENLTIDVKRRSTYN